MTAAAPIAIFDSGVGGLTVARALAAALPAEELVYLGDTARVPYGPKSPATVKRFAGECVEFLLRFRPKLVIIACNTASATALDYLQEKVDVPLIGVIEPGARAAVAATKRKKVGVIGTRATVASGAYARAVAALQPDISVLACPCPLFVPLVEEGRTDGPIVEAIAAEYLQPLVAREVDAIVLGCTHYPVLRPVIQKVVGASVTLIDSAEAVSLTARELLERRGEAQPANAPGPAARFFVTDVVEDFARVARAIWPGRPGQTERVELA